MFPQAFALVCLSMGVAGHLLACSPLLQVKSPRAGEVLHLSGSRYNRFEISYSVSWPCGFPPLPSSSASSAHLVDGVGKDFYLAPPFAAFNRTPPSVPGARYSVTLEEHHSVDPGKIEVMMGEPIVLIVSEAGSYIFELTLWVERGGLHGGDDGGEALPPQRTRLSSAVTQFEIVSDTRIGTSDACLEGFEGRRNVYDMLGRSRRLTLLPPPPPPRSTPHEQASPGGRPLSSGGSTARTPSDAFLPPPSRSRGAGGTSSPPSVDETRLSYFGAVPSKLRARMRPLSVILIGGVSPPFDGTKQFIVQYETVVDRRVVSFSHLDMMSDPEEGAEQLMAKMLMNERVPLFFHRIPLSRDTYRDVRDFMLAGNAMMRLPGWCSLSPRMKEALRALSEFLAPFDTLWRINHDPKEEYLQQLPRLVNPAIVRINDLVGRMDLPCRFSRLSTDYFGEEEEVEEVGGGGDAKASRKTRAQQILELSKDPSAAAASPPTASPREVGWTPLNKRMRLLRPKIGLGVPSYCFQEQAEAAAVSEGWSPFHTDDVAYTWRDYDAEASDIEAAVGREEGAGGGEGGRYLVQQHRDGVAASSTTSSSLAAVQARSSKKWAALDLPLGMEPQRGVSGSARPPGGETTSEWLRDGHLSWHPISYELLVAPSHFVAQHAMTRRFASKVLILPGLNSRHVSPIPWATHDATPSWSICGRLWMGPKHEELMNAALLSGRAKRLLLGGRDPPIVLAFIGRIAREKGTGIFLHAVREMALLLEERGYWKEGYEMFDGPPPTAAADESSIRHLPSSLLKRVKRLSWNSTRIRIVIIGSAATVKYLAHMKELAEALGLHSDIIDFVGFVAPEQLMDWYKHRCISAVVAPYLRALSETFGLVLTEAMSAQVPVIHFGVGGIADYAIPGENSLAPINVSAAALGETLASVAQPQNMQRLRQLGDAAASFTRANIRRDLNAFHIEALLRKEHAAAQLLYRHVKGGYKDLPFSNDTLPARRMCGSDYAVTEGQGSGGGKEGAGTSSSSSPRLEGGGYDEHESAITWHAAVVHQTLHAGTAQGAAGQQSSLQCTVDFPLDNEDAVGSLRLRATLKEEDASESKAGPTSFSSSSSSLSHPLILNVDILIRVPLTSNLETATAILPGFEDTLCLPPRISLDSSGLLPQEAQQRAEACVDLRSNILDSARERLQRHAALCFAWGSSSPAPALQNEAKAETRQDAVKIMLHDEGCTHFVDIDGTAPSAPPTSASGDDGGDSHLLVVRTAELAIPRLSGQRLGQSLLLAIADSRLPNVLLALSRCTSMST